MLCIHLHLDHVGWHTRLEQGRWVPTFPNAKYLFGQSEWDYWREHYTREAFIDDSYYTDTLLPVMESGRARFIEGDHVFNDAVWLEPTPGHTPGHVGVHIRSRGAGA